MPTVYTADWVLPVAGEPIEHGGVAVADGRIVAVGPAAELDGAREAFPGAVIAPGFVNAHTHLEYEAYAGFGDALPFPEWLGVHVERKRRLDWDSTVAIALAGAGDCLATGVTTVGDVSFTGAGAIAASELGLGAIVHLEVFGADASELETRFAESRARIEHVLSDRVRLGVSPHAPYTAGPELYAACLELGLPVVTHLAESVAERQWLVDGSGPWSRLEPFLVPPLGDSAVRGLERYGLLSSRLTAVHCVTLDDEEIELLAARGVAVVHCPRSNAQLGCGGAPLARLRARGVRVGLGTDSPASTPSFDVFDEMRAAILVARTTEARADALTVAQTLELATLGAARALGLADELGSFEMGKRADLVIVDMADSPFVPWDDPVAALVLGGAPARVLRTIVDGVTRYSRGGERWHELRQNAQSARGRMLATRSGP